MDDGSAPPGGKAGVRIRMYRVGFGDFFLVSVPSNGGQAHILVDCGVHAHDIKAMPAALAQMKADTGGKLALVIMTHRHADHISGFASGKDVFAGFTVERVWMSWFEDPDDQVGARIQSQLTAVAQHLHAALTARAAQPGPDDEQYQNMVGNILGLAAGASNDVALRVLRSFKTPEGHPTPVDYYRAGDPAKLPPSLASAGLTAQILGPPTDLALVAEMDNHAHQYLTATGGRDSAHVTTFDPVFATRDYAWPRLKGDPHWLDTLYDPAVIKQHIDESMPDALAAAAQNADNAINNQSVVVLFGFQGKTMLFCGDAQWGNWANFLFGGPVGESAELTPASSQILGALDFLKVGHHGSTNATPIDVVKALRQGCVAMCSTDPGAYGNPAKGTEVPRTPLLAALAEKTGNQLARSDQISAGTATPTAGLGNLAAVFEAGPGEATYIDYLL
jgi:beta-lactamase superfamily II metal-dependent hydrolase